MLYWLRHAAVHTRWPRVRPHDVSWPHVVVGFGLEMKLRFQCRAFTDLLSVKRADW